MQWPEKSKSLAAVTEDWAVRIRDAWEAAPLREALLDEMCKELGGARQYIRESDRPPFNLLSLAEVLAMDSNSVWENAVYLAFKTIDLVRMLSVDGSDVFGRRSHRAKAAKSVLRVSRRS